MESFAAEGLDYILGTFPRATQAVPTTLYLGLFTSQTPSTVPDPTAILATNTGVTEAGAAGGYARQPIISTAWGVPTAETGGRRVATATAIAFPESTAAYSAQLNGFFIATALTGGVAFYYANFTDDQPVNVLTAGVTVRMVPYWEYGF